LGHTRARIGNAPAHHRSAANLEPVPACQHGLAGRTGACLQHGPRAGSVRHKESHIVQVKSFFDQINHLADELIGLQDRAGARATSAEAAM